MIKHCNSCDNIEIDMCHSSLRLSKTQAKWHDIIGYDKINGLNCEYWMKRGENKPPRLNMDELYNTCTSCKKTFRADKLKVFAKGSKFLCEECIKSS